MLINISDKVDKLTEKVDFIKDNITDVKIIQARHDENLKEHMRRTALLEEADKKLVEELKPIKLHVSRVDGVLKFIGLLSGIAGIATLIFKLLGKI